jgi:uncharacterized membrane protein YuzA (DUF378 family)
MKALHMLTFLLLVVGGLNWLLVGAFNFDLVATLLGDMSTLSRAVYVLVGVSAVVELVTHKKNCRLCNPGA